MHAKWVSIRDLQTSPENPRFVALRIPDVDYQVYSGFSVLKFHPQIKIPILHSLLSSETNWLRKGRDPIGYNVLRIRVAQSRHTILG
jgi:hypothetical protein